MAYDQYLITFRVYAWWVTFDGVQTGPHASERFALNAAVFAAKVRERTGHQAEIFIEGAAAGLPATYKSADLNVPQTHVESAR